MFGAEISALNAGESTKNIPGDLLPKLPGGREGRWEGSRVMGLEPSQSRKQRGLPGYHLCDPVFIRWLVGLGPTMIICKMNWLNQLISESYSYFQLLRAETLSPYNKQE